MPLAAYWKRPSPPSSPCRCFSSSLSTAPYWSPALLSARPMSWWLMPFLRPFPALAARTRTITTKRAMTSTATSPAILMTSQKAVSAASAQHDLQPSAVPLSVVEACALSDAPLKTPPRVVLLIRWILLLQQRRNMPPAPLAHRREAGSSLCLTRLRSRPLVTSAIPMRSRW